MIPVVDIYGIQLEGGAATFAQHAPLLFVFLFVYLMVRWL